MEHRLQHTDPVDRASAHMLRGVGAAVAPGLAVGCHVLAASGTSS